MISKVIDLGEEVLFALTFPGLFLFNDPLTGLVFTIMFWQFTIPCFMVFYPMYAKYCKIFKKDQ